MKEKLITFRLDLWRLYLKGKIAVNKNFVKFTLPHTILYWFPVGSETHSISSTQVASVATSFSFSVKSFVLGLASFIFGCKMFHDDKKLLGFVLVVIGIEAIICAFRTILMVTSTAGDDYPLFFYIFNKKKAYEAEELINDMIAGRLDDTNVKDHTEAQTEAIKQTSTVQTEAIVSAINDNHPAQEHIPEEVPARTIKNTNKQCPNCKEAFLQLITDPEFKIYRCPSCKKKYKAK